MFNVKRPRRIDNPVDAWNTQGVQVSRRPIQKRDPRNGRTESTRRRNHNFYRDKVHLAKSRIKKAVRRRGKGAIPASSLEDAVTWLLATVLMDDGEIGRGTEVIDVIIETDQGFSLNS